MTTIDGNGTVDGMDGIMDETEQRLQARLTQIHFLIRFDSEVREARQRKGKARQVVGSFVHFIDSFIGRVGGWKEDAWMDVWPYFLCTWADGWMDGWIKPR